jgi:hypothetical protein
VLRGAAFVGAVVGGLVLFFVVIALVASFGSRLAHSESEAGHVRDDAGGFFQDNGVPTATVDSCGELRELANQGTLYRCQIEAPSCNRHFRFVLGINFGVGRGLAPYAVPWDAGAHPCAYPSD